MQTPLKCMKGRRYTIAIWKARSVLGHCFENSSLLARPLRLDFTLVFFILYLEDTL